ncbi:hypothetical protein ACP275_10G116300 [Erythranthe tilingii]
MDITTASAASASSESLILRALIDRGWRFRDTDRIRGLITDQLSITSAVDSIERELLNLDLRSIGGKCLPEPSLLRKTSHLQGPIVLQVCSIRDISRSSVADAAGNSGNRRLLRLKLTDGYSEITAVEYSNVPSITEDVSPGTKVRVQGKAHIYSSILCLNEKTITVLGGVVQSLNEEWLLKRKYMDVPRNTLRLSQENSSGCPPPFEKLQIRASVQGTKGMHASAHTTGFSATSSKDLRHSLAAKGESSNLSETAQILKNNATMDSVTDDAKLLHNVGENTEKPTAPARPKVTASIPVQNQVAAQKLLQKTTGQQNFSRGQRHNRERFQEEESSLMTLDEWERRRTRTGIDLPTSHDYSNIRQDEDLARQLQEQFDLEDIHVILIFFSPSTE